MGTIDVAAGRVRTSGRGEVDGAQRTALAAMALGTIALVAYAGIALLATRTADLQDGSAYQHAGDYWFTGIGVPIGLASMVLLAAAYRMLGARANRLALAGVVVNTVSLAVLVVMLGYCVVIGHEAQWGPTYVVGTLGTFVGHALFSAGAWRSGLLPRWVLGLWPLVFVLGSFGAVLAPGPLLLVALYAVIAYRFAHPSA